MNLVLSMNGEPLLYSGENIEGEYVIDDSYTDNKDDWHYVTIQAVDAAKGVYVWSNRAGDRYTLTQS